MTKLNKLSLGIMITGIKCTKVEPFLLVEPLTQEEMQLCRYIDIKERCINIKETELRKREAEIRSMEAAIGMLLDMVMTGIYFAGMGLIKISGIGNEILEEAEAKLAKQERLLEVFKQKVEVSTRQVEVSEQITKDVMNISATLERTISKLKGENGRKDLVILCLGTGFICMGVTFYTGSLALGTCAGLAPIVGGVVYDAWVAAKIAAMKRLYNKGIAAREIGFICGEAVYNAGVLAQKRLGAAVQTSYNFGVAAHKGLGVVTQKSYDFGAAVRRRFKPRSA